LHVVEAPDGLSLCVMNTGPEHNEFVGPFELNVDSADPTAIAQWWADRTGGTVNTREGADYVWIEGADGFPFHYWVFGAVPEPKTVKNRVHWDVVLRDATVSDLVDAGATVLREADDDVYWTVMADPEGNEFCAFLPSD
jgi:hypothetical protein